MPTSRYILAEYWSNKTIFKQDLLINKDNVTEGTLNNKILHTGWLQQRKFNFSQSWRLKAQDRHAGRFEFCRSLLPWLADSIFSLCPHMSFLCMQSSVISLCF